jgi:hypothetical protein
MILLIVFITVWFATLAALALRIAIVGRERTGPRTGGPGAWERSPHLLDAGRDSSWDAFNEALELTPAAPGSEPAPAEHVRDGAQEDLYVGP